MAYVSSKNSQGEEEEPYLSKESGEILPTDSGLNTNIAQPQKQEKGGSPFQDISRYLSQNQPQAQRLASQLGENVVQFGNQARNDITNSGNTFNTDVTSGTTPLNQGVINQVAHNPTGLFTFPQPPPPPPPAPPRQHGHGAQNSPTPSGGPIRVQPPVQVNLNHTRNPRPPTLPPPVVPNTGVPGINNQGLFDQFEAQRNAQYTGPTDITQQQGYQTAQNDINAANTQGQNLQSDTGRMDMLNNLYGSNYNSPGVTNFDNQLLQTAPAQNILSQSIGQNADLNPEIQDLATQAAQRVQGAQDTEAGARNAVDTAFFGPQGTYPAFQQDLQHRLTAAQQLYQQPNLTPQQIATQDDYNKLQALNQLLGTNYGIG